MRATDLFEAAPPAKASAAFCFGRFNPAHQGHVRVWQTVQAAGEKWFVGTNPKTHGPNDPLSFEQKALWMQAIWPEVSKSILPEQSVVTTAVAIYERLGKRDGLTIAYVTDDDDWRWSGKLLADYNGKEANHGFYKFASIIHVPSPRVSSATDLRNAARAGDEAAFYKAAGIDPSLKVKGKTYFETVREACMAQPEKKKKKVKEGILDDPNIQSAIGLTALSGTALGTYYVIDKMNGKAEDLILDHLNRKYPVEKGRWRSEEAQVKYREDRESLWNTYHNGGLLGLFRRIRAEQKELGL